MCKVIRSGVPSRLVVVLGAAAILTGCEGRVTIDMAADAPADPDIAQVQIPVRGVEFSKSDGTTETLEFRDTELIDFMDLLDGEPVRLFTDEDVGDGDYTGVRLLIDEEEDATVTLADGTAFPVAVAEGDYAPAAFSVEEEDSSSDSFTLSLDLRQSLSFDDDADEYTLEPRLRSVPSGDAAQISGNVTVTCPTGTSLAEGGAVYLFTGEDATAVDRVGDTGPFATTGLRISGLAGTATYALRFLPGGDYTVALTCAGDLDDPLTDDEVNFETADNVQLDDEEQLRVDLE